MHDKQAKLGRFGVAILAVLAVAAGLSGRAFHIPVPLALSWLDGHAVSSHLVAAARAPGVGLPRDWTHQHLVFSNPGTPQQAVAGQKFAQWQRIISEPRYLMQLMHRDPSLRGVVAAEAAAVPAGKGSGGGFPIGLHPPNPKSAGINKDWSKTLFGGIVNPNAFPAKFSFSDTTATCAGDFVVFPTGTAGATNTVATIIAYTNLYTTGCTGTVPTVLWEYNTAFVQSTNAADGSAVTTSPVLSFDGSQVAFIQVNTAGAASLVLLKWKSNTAFVELNTAATNVTNAAYRACPTPCMTRITLNGGSGDTWSAPFVDYFDDELYVGDNAGKLHQFTGVFAGTPAETTVSWPVTLTAGTTVASPVYDPTSGYVFVGTASGTGSGKLYQVGTGTVGTTTGAIHGTSAALANSTSGGIFDGVIVDSTTEKVYAFVATTAAQTSGCTTAGDNCVYQFAVNFANGNAGASEDLASGDTADPLFSGTFDNVYLSSTSGNAGNIWVESNTGADGGILFQVPFNGSGAMTAAVQVQTITATNHLGFGSPVTEFCNNGVSGCTASGTATTAGTDFIFVSTNRSSAAGCTNSSGNGCVMSLDVSLPTTRNEPATLSTSVFGSGSFTSAHGNFTAADVGKYINDASVSGNGALAALTTITVYTAGAINDTITVSPNYNNGFNGAADTITISGANPAATNLNLTTYANPGCWVTSGMIIDNAVPNGTLAGASQIYFITLGSAAAPPLCTGTTAPGGSMTGVQTSQSAP